MKIHLTRRQFARFGAGLAAFGVAGNLIPFRAAASDAEHFFSVIYEMAPWQPIFPDWPADSPEISVLHVNPHSQATHLLIRSRRAMHVPMHWHTANETHTIVRGSAVFECEGKRERLGVGSFNFIPSKMAHQAWLSEDFLVLITVDSAWDLNWVNGPPGPDVLGKKPPVE